MQVTAAARTATRVTRRGEPWTRVSSGGPSGTGARPSPRHATAPGAAASSSTSAAAPVPPMASDTASPT